MPLNKIVVETPWGAYTAENFIRLIDDTDGPAKEDLIKWYQRNREIFFRESKCEVPYSFVG